MAERLTPQVFEETDFSHSERYKYLKDWTEESDLRWPVSCTAYNLRYRLDYTGLLPLALMYYGSERKAPEHTSLDSHAAEFYKSKWSRATLVRRCTDIGAHTGGTNLDLFFRLFLHEIDLPFWRPAGYYQDAFGVRWMPGTKSDDYLEHRAEAQRPAEDEILEAEANRGDDLEYEDPQADHVEAPEHQVPQQHRHDRGWWHMVLSPVVWLLGPIRPALRKVQGDLIALLMLMLFASLYLVYLYGFHIVFSVFCFVASAVFTIVSSIISYLVGYILNLGHIAWSTIRCPRQKCELVPA